MQQFTHQGIFSSYGAMWVLFGVMFGVVSYTIDRTWLHSLYRWIYDLTHQKTLDKPQGFIFGQKVSQKVLIAGIISTIKSIIFVWYMKFDLNPLTEITLWLVVIPVMVFGFTIGFWAFPLWSKRKKLYESADHLGDRVEESLGGKKPTNPTPVAAPPQPVAAEAKASVVPAPPVPRKETPEETIARYASKH
jgi:uncharacterized membrane protein